MTRRLLAIVIAGIAIVGIVSDTCGEEGQQPRSVKDLKQLFETDPATAFEQAWAMFQTPLGAEDVDGMMAICRAVYERGGHLHEGGCWYGRVLQDMTDAAAPIAEEQGNWGALGELWTMRAGQFCAVGSLGVPAGKARFGHFMKLAHEAFQKYGSESPDFRSLRERYWDKLRAEGPQRFRAEDVHRYEMYREKNSVHFAEAIARIQAAFAEADDEAAVGRLGGLLDMTLAEKPELHSVVYQVLAFVGSHLWLRGAEELLPRYRRVVGMRAVWPGSAFASGGSSCVYAWSGGDDAFYQAIYWALNLAIGKNDVPRMFFPEFAKKLAAFGRPAEAERVMRRWVGLMLERPIEVRGSSARWAPRWTFERMSPDVRRSVLDLSCSQYLYRGMAPERTRQRREGQARPDQTVVGLLNSMKMLVGFTPEGEKDYWRVQAAIRVRDTVLQFPDPASKAIGLEGTAKMFEEAGEKAVAEETWRLAEAIASGDPGALFECALRRAQSAAREDQWEQVRAALEPLVSGRKPSAELLQAMLLLKRASDRLQRSGDARKWLARAEQVLGAMQPSAGTRANYLMNIASVTENGDHKVALLKRARSAAAETGVELLQQKADDRVAAAALTAGDLDAARDALLTIVKRQESKRQALAFDPVLRQQWFADNITPYRKLLRVAALQDDPYLALSCAERMRSRVLVDELAWQKLDMAVELMPEERQRLEQLGAMRQQATYLLQHVLGGSAGGEVEPSRADERGKYMPVRGKYMPIRGMYMPVRGPGDGGEQAGAVDTEKLRQLLEELRVEEAALESAIREAIPAYARASDMAIPSGEELVAAVRADPELGVLHYTLCDEGLVVVAVGPAGVPQIALIEADGEELWQRVGAFREMIWEREEEVFEEAKELYDLLLGPVAGSLAGVKRLWVIADGALQLLPFNALMLPDGVFLGYYTAAATAPSLTLPLQSRGERPAPETSAVIVAGPNTGFPDVDAQLAEGDSGGRGKYMPIRGMHMPVRGKYMPIRGEGGVSSALTSMAIVPLPGARAEGEAIARRFAGAELLTGKAATKSRLLAEGGNCEILHLATHGYADPELPELSGLLLASEGEQAYDVLTAGEVYGWALNARLVTLSACQTALGKTVEGEGLIGLTRAFIHAGARDVVCSLWPVADESTRKLMTLFYANLDSGERVERALQEAQKDLMREKATNHPFYWAGFVAVRGPR